MRFLDGPRPRFFAHRGGALEAPENTLEALSNGLEQGADRLEIDVLPTADGEIVVTHDDVVDRTTDGSGAVSSFDLAALQRLDAGYRFVDAAGGHPFRGRGVRIPTLSEVFERFPDIPLNIEIKEGGPAEVQKVLDVIDRYGARDLVLLAAEGGVMMERIRETAAGTGIVYGSSADDVVAFLAAWESGTLADYVHPGIALQVPTHFGELELVTAECLARAHEKGLEVHVWTVDDAEEIRRLLELGVDGIMTDRPSVAARVFADLGLR